MDVISSKSTADGELPLKTQHLQKDLAFTLILLVIQIWFLKSPRVGKSDLTGRLCRKSWYFQLQHLMQS